jgi:hypothetical protein
VDLINELVIIDNEVNIPELNVELLSSRDNFNTTKAFYWARCLNMWYKPIKWSKASKKGTVLKVIKIQDRQEFNQSVLELNIFVDNCIKIST